MNLLVPGWQRISLLDHIYLGVIAKVSTLTQFPLVPGCDYYCFFFWTRQWSTCNSFLMDSIYTPKLDASLAKANAVPSSISLGFLHSVLFLIPLDYH